VKLRLAAFIGKRWKGASGLTATTVYASAGKLDAVEVGPTVSVTVVVARTVVVVAGPYDRCWWRFRAAETPKWRRKRAAKVMRCMLVVSSQSVGAVLYEG
jgi:hypothetical protein